MADVDELMQMLQKADAAGDAEGAKFLLQAIDEQMNLSSQNNDEVVFQGSMLPFNRTESGAVNFDSDAGLVGVAKDTLQAGQRALSLPGEVYRGEVDPNTQEGINRAGELALFAAPVNPAFRSGSQAVPGVANALKPGVPKAPTSDELLDAGRLGFDQFRDLGVDYNPAQVRQTADIISQQLRSKGFHPKTADKTHGILDEVINLPEDAVVDTGNIQAIRQSLGKAGGNFNNPTDQAASGIATRAFDEFLEGGASGPTVDNATRGAGDILKQANANYAAGKRSQTIQGVEDAAELRASTLR